MKRLLLSALLILSVSAASAQSLSSLHPVQEASLVVRDGSHTLSPAQIDTLQQGLKLKFAGARVREDNGAVLYLIVDAYELKKGWHHVTLRAELAEVVKRVQEPSILTNAITWRTNTGHILNATFYSPCEAIGAALEKVTDHIVAVSSQAPAVRLGLAPRGPSSGGRHGRLKEDQRPGVDPKGKRAPIQRQDVPAGESAAKREA